MFLVLWVSEWDNVDRNDSIDWIQTAPPSHWPKPRACFVSSSACSFYIYLVVIHIFVLDRSLLHEQFFKGESGRSQFQNLTMLWSWLFTSLERRVGWVLVACILYKHPQEGPAWYGIHSWVTSHTVPCSHHSSHFPVRFVLSSVAYAVMKSEQKYHRQGLMMRYLEV